MIQYSIPKLGTYGHTVDRIFEIRIVPENPGYFGYHNKKLNIILQTPLFLDIIVNHSSYYVCLLNMPASLPSFSVDKYCPIPNLLPKDQELVTPYHPGLCDLFTDGVSDHTRIQQRTFCDSIMDTVGKGLALFTLKMLS